MSSRHLIDVRGLSVHYGPIRAVHDVNLAVERNRITALIGPSGCGKTTFLRALNRMHDLTPAARVKGRVVFAGQDIYGPGVNPVEVRRRIGMVFQKPNPFPAMSIYGNVASGLRLAGMRKRALLDERVEQALTQAALWDEVRDRLSAPATSLSGGQQQRLCIARALAVNPAVLLMDEPTSALDPRATRQIEELLESLRREVTIVIVTHNLQQARRISDHTAFFLLDPAAGAEAGNLVEHGPTADIFSCPADPRTAAYIEGRFG
ncbi:MAG TPA: phosphate ABC transporter ATP-binding protein PstB [Deinococcales bacterium]|nr:phosphate ABC transporter ATP-binding protein PstB [Deinococcales bacterium]